MLPRGFYERTVKQMNRAHDAMVAAKAMGNTPGYNIALAEVVALAKVVADARARNYAAIPLMARIDAPLTKVDTQGT